MLESCSVETLESRLHFDEKILEKIEDFLATAPAGSLMIENRNGRLICKHSEYSKGDKRTSKYIKKKDIKQAEILAKKAYFLDMKSLLEAEIDMIKRFLDDYDPLAACNVYSNLADTRKQLVSPLFETVDEKVEAWRRRMAPGDRFHPENLIYETEKCELRRSKSEVDISDKLDKHSDILEYRYEPRLYLPMSGETFSPDFAIINLQTGCEYIWEHNGGFSFDGYGEHHAYKMQCYSREPLEFRRHLLCTYETSDHPLQPSMIDEMINQMIESR